MLLDPTDTIFTYLKAPTGVGGISVAVDIAPDKHTTGMIGLPEGAVERRLSEHVYFLSDRLSILWKFRGDCRSLWSSSVTNLNGATVGDAAIIAQR